MTATQTLTQARPESRKTTPRQPFDRRISRVLRRIPVWIVVGLLLEWGPGAARTVRVRSDRQR